MLLGLWEDAALGGLLFFAVQLLLCRKVRRLAVRLIPVYALVLLAAWILVLASGAFDHPGTIFPTSLLAVVLLLDAAGGGIGDVLAWTVHAVWRWRRG